MFSMATESNGSSGSRFRSAFASSRVVDLDVPDPDDAIDVADVDFVEPDATGEAVGTGLSPKDKLQLRVRCFRSTGRLARLSANDGRPLRFMPLVRSA